MTNKGFIHPTAIIHPNVVLGENVYIGPYSIIGYPAEMREDFYESEYSVLISDNTIITGNCTIDAGFKENTVIGRNCFIMKGVHIGHDSIIEDNVTLSAHAVLAGHVRVCQSSNIGINSSIHQFSLIGHGSMVGMGSIVTKKSVCKPFDKIVGSPAKSIGENTHSKSKFNEEEIKSFIEEYESIKNKYYNI
jgi:UDP-N-acetylglucosamine acyltransferase